MKTKRSVFNLLKGEVFLIGIIGNKMRDFALIVILVSAVIAGFLVMSSVSFAANSGDQKYAYTIELILEIDRALENYRLDNGFYPTTEQGLYALTHRPRTDPIPQNYKRGVYMGGRWERDSWRKPIIYRSHGLEGPIDIISCGPDGIEGTEDDITNHDEYYKKAKEDYDRQHPNEPFRHHRIKAIGDLPEDHDPTLVLRKGRTVTVISNHYINGKNHFTANIPSVIKDDIYDDTDQILLIPGGIELKCAYRFSVEQDIVKIFITAIEMKLWPPDSFPKEQMTLMGMLPTIMFTSPPRYISSDELIGRIFPDNYKEYSRLVEQLFISPAMNAELVFVVESEDHASRHEKIIFGENASGDRTISIESGYEVELKVRKDILFFGPSNERK